MVEATKSCELFINQSVVGIIVEIGLSPYLIVKYCAFNQTFKQSPFKLKMKALSFIIKK